MNLNTEDTEITIEIDDESNDTNKLLLINQLFDDYNLLQDEESKSNNTISEMVRVADIDGINGTVLAAIKQVESLAKTYEEKNTTTSKALSIFGKTPFLGRFINKTTDSINNEKINNKTIDEVMESLKISIHKKKDETIALLQSLGDQANGSKAQLAKYQKIIDATEDLKGSKELGVSYKSRELQSFALSAKQDILEFITQEVKPLMDGADQALTTIYKVLPTLNNKMKRKLSTKAALDSLRDLNSIVGGSLELTHQVDTMVTHEIRATQLEVLELAKSGITNIDKLKNIKKETDLHNSKVMKLLQDIETHSVNQNNLLNKLETDEPDIKFAIPATILKA